MAITYRRLDLSRIIRLFAPRGRRLTWPMYGPHKKDKVESILECVYMIG